MGDTDMRFLHVCLVIHAVAYIEAQNDLRDESDRSQENSFEAPAELDAKKGKSKQPQAEPCFPRYSSKCKLKRELNELNQDGALVQVVEDIPDKWIPPTEWAPEPGHKRRATKINRDQTEQTKRITAKTASKTAISHSQDSRGPHTGTTTNMERET